MLPGKPGIELAEGLKKRGQVLAPDTHARVLDLQSNEPTRCAGGCCLELFSQRRAERYVASFGEFDGVAQQIDEYLFDSPAIADHLPQLCRDGADERKAFLLRHWPHRGEHVFE